MSALAKAIRQRRFNVKSDKSVKLLLDTRTGTQHTLNLNNCSINGMGATSEIAFNLDDDFEIGTIVPAAKLIFDGQEIHLGRLTVRYRIAKGGENGPYIGFATVDAKLPVDGILSKYLAGPGPEGELNPFGYELSPEQFSLASFVEHHDSNIDLFARCRKFGIFYRDLQKTEKYIYNEVREASKGSRIQLKRMRKNNRNDYIQMAAYDYLNLGSHPKVLEAANEANQKYGYASGGSPVICGLTVLHEELAEKLARMVRKESVLLFNSGYAANVGTIQGLTMEQDLIVADMLSHASLHDGMSMSSATSRFFIHNHMGHLEKVLRENRADKMGALVITEGVFSMDGDKGDIVGVVDVAKKYNARVMVDEAHSFGLYGRSRAGVCDVVNRLDQVDVYMSSLSKVCGAGGGFIAATRDVTDWLTSYGRSRMFSGSMPASSAAAGIASLDLIMQDTERVTKLFQNVKHFAAGMRELGANISEDHDSPIVPIVIGDEKKMGTITNTLIEAGIYVVPIVYPAVSKNQCRFRFSLMSEHTISDLDYVVATFERAMKAADFKFKAPKAK